MGHASAINKLLLPSLGLVALSAAPTSQAAQLVKLSAAFSPDRLGASTTILIDFTVGTSTGQVPSPLTQVSMRLPKGVDLSTTKLGLAVCQPAVLEAQGPEGCPSDSVMGLGSATAEVPIGPFPVQETARLTIIMGPAIDHHTTMMFYANGATPVSAQLIFPGELLPDSGPFGGRLTTYIPRTPTLPGGANVSVIYVSTSIGPAGVRYYRRQHGKTIAYEPEGIAIPSVCPSGGFPFAASFRFEDGTSASATARAACPNARRSSVGRDAGLPGNIEALGLPSQDSAPLRVSDLNGWWG